MGSTVDPTRIIGMPSNMEFIIFFMGNFDGKIPLLVRFDDGPLGSQRDVLCVA